MSKKSIHKGSKYERDISVKLSKWITNNEMDDAFWRTQGSGSRYTVRKKSGLKTYGQNGDISSTHPITSIFNELIVIDCKHYSDIDLWGLITDSKNGINKFCDKILKDCDNNKYPILIVKQNRKPELFITIRQLALSILTIIDYKLIFKNNNHIFYVFLLSDLLNSNPTLFINKLKALKRRKQKWK